jgi:hypothetical protein
MQNRVMTVEQMLPPDIDVSAIQHGSEVSRRCVSESRNCPMSDCALAEQK